MKNDFGWYTMNSNFTPSMSKLFHNGKNESGNLFDSWSYTKKNYILFISGVIMIILGYVIMAVGDTYSFQSLSVAPILLTIGYIFLIPASLIYKDRKSAIDKN
jgi:hypothetical protein